MAPYIPYVGVALFAVGMYGNIRAEGTLFRLRKEEAHRRRRAVTTAGGGGKATTTKSPSGNEDSTKNIYSKVYVIPPATGYFRFVLFPHYALEWLEWFGFMLMGFGVTAPGAASASAAAAGAAAPPIPLAPYYVPLSNFLINKLGLGPSLPLPLVFFFVNSVTTTMARATWGRKWYTERFGQKAVDGRTAVVPYLI